MRRLAPLVVLLLAGLLRPDTALGCASCFGQSDSPLAQGMNWGIAAMLVVVVGMWIGFGTFFVYLARRASKAADPASQPAEPAPSAANVEPT